MKTIDEKAVEEIKPIDPGFVGGHASGEKWLETDKPLDEAAKDSKTEMSAEEQQALLKQIIQGTRRKAAGFFKTPGKAISKDAEKKRKAKNKQSKKSRRANRKK
jgi:hypothetical protein